VTVPERFLTIDEAAELVNYPPATIEAWLGRGLPHVVPGGTRRPRRKDIRIRFSALVDWVRGLEVVRTPAPGTPPAGAVPRPGGKARRLSAWRDLP
jgi:hypothetical protein